MKKLLLITPFLFFACSRDSDTVCQQTWQVSEWTRYDCSPANESEHRSVERTFKCDEVKDIKEGQTVVYKTDGCYKYYRIYNKRVN
ncbi:hypothetical protein [Elizabethkingia miricola]|uniref:hypothetical protein n=1 Tax=Elizabethkingia miricola TaxID=172045 RepID=UPI000B34C3F8|nr:hypothetical protein [Elizabethkingia miricola]